MPGRAPSTSSLTRVPTNDLEPLRPAVGPSAWRSAVVFPNLLVCSANALGDRQGEPMQELV
jgi:hypothetical protein